ncbi:MAG: discoidin domain-containing protein, partial [Oscillospiraceae bacterium]|nr:discoidin domain-containing protein [Oscillospiraceae bacterium]
NLAEGSTLTADYCKDDRHTAQMALDPDPTHYWHSGAFSKPVEFILDLGEAFDVNKVVLKEHIATGQQIEKFSLWWDSNLPGEGAPKWERLASETVIGYKRICRFDERRLQRLKLVLEEVRGFATLEAFEAY